MYQGLKWVNGPATAFEVATKYFLEDGPGRRGYIDYGRSTRERLVLKEEYRAHPGELVLPEPRARLDGVTIHTDVKPTFTSPGNRRWPHWHELVRELDANDVRVWQVDPSHVDGVIGAERQGSDSVRDDLAVVGTARLLITTEGLFHHAAAALGVPTIVLMGGRINPAILGYESQRNLTALEDWCGMRVKCDHCERAMRSITPDRVMAEVLEVLGE